MDSVYWLQEGMLSTLMLSQNVASFIVLKNIEILLWKSPTPQFFPQSFAEVDTAQVAKAVLQHFSRVFIGESRSSVRRIDAFPHRKPHTKGVACRFYTVISICEHHTCVLLQSALCVWLLKLQLFDFAIGSESVNISGRNEVILCLKHLLFLGTMENSILYLLLSHLFIHFCFNVGSLYLCSLIQVFEFYFFFYRNSESAVNL